MNDEQIVALYWARSESAVEQTRGKYGALLLSIARRILSSREDSEECVNDTYLAAWNSIPPKRPVRLPPYLGRIVRNLALDRYDYNHAQKRGGFTGLLEELHECIPGTLLETQLESRVIGQTVDAFLAAQPERVRTVFLRRYWYCQSVRDIAAGLEMSQNQVKSILFRARKRLRAMLEQEGIAV